jgi:hypothetical protein
MFTPHVQAGNILIDHQGQVILADMGITTAMTRSHRLHEGGALDSQPQVLAPVFLQSIAHHVHAGWSQCGSPSLQH